MGTPYPCFIARVDKYGSEKVQFGSNMTLHFVLYRSGFTASTPEPPPKLLSDASLQCKSTLRDFNPRRKASLAETGNPFKKLDGFINWDGRIATQKP